MTTVFRWASGLQIPYALITDSRVDFLRLLEQEAPPNDHVPGTCEIVAIRVKPATREGCIFMEVQGRARRRKPEPKRTWLGRR